MTRVLIRCCAFVVVTSLGALVARSAPPAPSTTQPDIRSEFSQLEIKRILQHSPLPSLPPQTTNRFADDPRAARLGQFLFFDARLSRNGTLSCSTCHDPSRGFADGKPLGEGLAKLNRHTISLWNAAYDRWLFWDGRADSLWSQSLHPIERSDELGSNRMRIAHTITNDKELRSALEGIFGPLPDFSNASRFPSDAGPIATEPAWQQAWDSMIADDQRLVNRVFVNVGKSIEAYERKLVSRNSPFDQFVEGLRENDSSKLSELSASARRGLKLFVGRGECRLCHSGPTFTDGEFHDVGIPPRSNLPPDAGRFDGIRQLLANPFNAAGEFSHDRTGGAAQRLEFIAQGQQNWGQFKTPTLRNVALTAPYMHQGQMATLDQVIEHYSTLADAAFAGHHREAILQPRNFTAEEAANLKAFLNSLTDDKIDQFLLTKPATP